MTFFCKFHILFWTAYCMKSCDPYFNQKTQVRGGLWWWWWWWWGGDYIEEQHLQERKLLKTVWPVRRGNAYIVIIYYLYYRTIHQKDKLLYIDMEKSKSLSLSTKKEIWNNFNKKFRCSDTTSTASTHGYAWKIDACTFTAYALSSLIYKQVSMKFLTVT